MRFHHLIFAAAAASAAPAPVPAPGGSSSSGRGGGSVSVTPHDKYSSSVGVLGCKIDTNRVAYWPGSISCDSICIKVTNEGRSVNLLRIDQSQGAHDISYDAWNYLVTGSSARKNPQMGGGVAMEYEEVPASECADLILTDDGRLPLSASNSINYLASCLAQPKSWVAQNHVLYNVLDAICTWGYDEKCTLDLAVSNQPACPHTLGLTVELKNCPVYDVQYGTGEITIAGSGRVVGGPAGDQPNDAAPSVTRGPTSTASQIISSVVATTLSTRVASSIFKTTAAPPQPVAVTSLPAPEVVPTPTTTPEAANPPAATTSAPPKGGGFIEQSGANDEALTFWTKFFLLPVLEKWGSS